VRARTFPDLGREVRVTFARSHAPLACISLGSRLTLITLNRALDGPDTPVEVMAHILTHELIHLEVPRQRIDGRWTTHPPAFWARQAELSPEAPRSEDWIFDNIGHCIHRYREGIWVCPRRLRR
jgi:hypothetical protein